MTISQPPRSRATKPSVQALARWEADGGAPSPQPVDGNGIAALSLEEVHIILKLGTAVIGQWNDLPTSIQRQIFAAAAVAGEEKQSMLETKHQVARFLHKHKDDLDNHKDDLRVARSHPANFT